MSLTVEQALQMANDVITMSPVGHRLFKISYKTPSGLRSVGQAMDIHAAKTYKNIHIALQAASFLGRRKDAKTQHVFDLTQTAEEMLNDYLAE